MFNLLILAFLSLSFSFCAPFSNESNIVESVPSFIRLEPSVDDISRKETWRDAVEKCLTGGNPADLSLYLSSRPSLKYNYFEELEEHFMECLGMKQYAFASVFIKEGVRIPLQDLYNIIVQVIEDGEAAILDEILQSHLALIGNYLDFHEMFRKAVESGNLEIMQVLLSFPFLLEEVKVAFVVEMSKVALEAGHNEIVKLLIDSCDKMTRKFILVKIMSLCTSPERFFVIERCVEDKIMLLGVSVSERYQILQTAAEKGNKAVTERLVLNFLRLAEYVKRNLDASDSPVNIARRNKYEEIVEFYREIFEEN